MADAAPQNARNEPALDPTHEPDADRPHPSTRIETRDVLRRMIADDLRAGRLTPARRRRIIRYAASFGLYTADARQLVAECRDHALRHGDPAEQACARRLMDRPARRKRTLALLAAIALLTIALDAAVVALL